MTQVIYKYLLSLNRHSVIPNMPVGAKILKVAEQRGVLYVWALVDPDARVGDAEFYIVGTGDPVPVNLSSTCTFLDTVLCEGGELVWHIWIKK